MSSPWAAIALVVCVLGAALAGAAILRRRTRISGEAARKLVHVVLGLVSALFPLLFSDRWPVWVLAGASMGGLSAVRWAPHLRGRLGGSLHDVGRDSWGEFCFPLSVAFVWSLAPGDWVRFSLPLLVLTVADALAALIGRRYGRSVYRTSGGLKSWEGSAAFAVAAFLVVYVPLRLGTTMGRVESFWIGVNMALLLMLVESMAWEGFDNLFIPIAGALLINKGVGSSAATLAVSAAVMVGLSFYFWWWRRRTTLDDGAVLAGAVLSYILWNLGGGIWLVAPLTLFALYARLYPPRDAKRLHSSVMTLAVALPALVWLLMEARFPGDLRWPIAAAGAGAIHLAAIGLLHEAHHNAARPWPLLLFKSWLMGTGIVLVPTAVLMGARVFAAAGVVALGGIGGLVALWVSLADRRGMPMSDRRWFQQALAALAGSAVVMAVHP